MTKRVHIAKRIGNSFIHTRGCWKKFTMFTMSLNKPYPAADSVVEVEHPLLVGAKCAYCSKLFVKTATVNSVSCEYLVHWYRTTIVGKYSVRTLTREIGWPLFADEICRRALVVIGTNVLFITDYENLNVGY